MKSKVVRIDYRQVLRHRAANDAHPDKALDALGYRNKLARERWIVRWARRTLTCT